MDDLFAFTAPAPESASVVSSGPVPRTIMPGIVWDEAAEKSFRAAVAELRTKFDFKWSQARFAADVEREARWIVEIGLHQKFAKERMAEADRTWEPAEKRALVARWRAAYGATRTEMLVNMAKSEHLKRVIREEW